MALSFVGAGSAQANTVTIPAGHQAGDLLVMFGFRDDSTTAPSAPAGWNSAGLNTGTLCSSIVAWKRATSSSETSGTWTNALGLVCHVYRGAFTSGPPIIRQAAQASTSPTVNYSGITTMYEAGGSSWVTRFAGISTDDTSIETAPTGHTFRTNAGGGGGVLEVAGFDTNGGVTSSSFGSTSVGGTAGNYITVTVEIIADNAGTGVEAVTGQLTGATATGNQAITSPAIQPKALMIWHGLQTASGATDDTQLTVGFGDTSGLERSAGYNSNAAVATADTVRHFRTGDIIRSYSAGTTTSNLAASLSQLDRTGFTLTWGDVTLNSALYDYLAIGGQDVTNVAVGSYAMNTATGNQSVTGVGFQPDIVLFIATLQTSNAAANNASQFSFGAMDSSGNQWAVTQKGQNAVNPANTNRAFTNDSHLSFTQTAADNFAHKQSFVSMDSDGFTVHIDTAVGLACLVGYMCIKGGSWKVGNDTQKTSTGTKSTTGLGFTPSGVILASVGDTQTSGIATSGRLSLGAVTSGQNTVIWTGDTDAVTPVVANTYYATDKALVMATEGASASPTINAAAALSSLDSGGFTLNWTTADATARVFGYIAFGATAAPPAGSSNQNFLTLGVG